MKKFVIILSAVLAVFAAALFFFIKSGNLVIFIESAVSTFINQPVRLGSLQFEKGPSITVKKLSVAEGKPGDMVLFLPEAHISLTLEGIWNRIIDEVVLESPELTLSSFGTSRTSNEAVLLPFEVRKAQINQGIVNLKLDDSSSLQARGITLSIKQRDKSGEADLTASASVPGYISKVLFTGLADIRRLNLLHAQVRISGADLGALSKQLVPRSYKKMAVTGVAEITADIKQDSENTLRGQKNIAISGSAQVKSDWIAAGGVTLSKFDAEFPLLYQNGRVLSKKAIFSARELNGFISHDNQEHAFKASMMKMAVPAFEYKDQNIQSGPVEIHVKHAVVFKESKELISSSGLFMKGSFTADIKRKTVQLKNLSMASDFISDLSGDISYSEGKSPELNASLTWEQIDIKNLTEFMQPSFTRKSGLNMHGTGTLQTVITMTGHDDGTYVISGSAQAKLTDAGFASLDETNIGEGIQSELSASFSIPLPFEHADVSINAHASGFELLAGKFYGNFKEKGLACSASGRYVKQDDSFFLSGAEISLTDIGKLTLTGSLSGPWASPDIRAKILLSDLANTEAFNFFVRETFREQIPLLAGLEIDGESRADVSLNGNPGRFTVKGMLDISNMNIVSKEKDRSITGIQVSLPFDLSYPEAELLQGRDEYGRISIDKLSWGILQMEAILAFPSVTRNTMIFREDIAINLFGGTIRLHDILYSDILSPGRSLGLGVNIRDIDLSRTAEALKIQRFNGSLSGVIPRAVLSGNRLKTEGEVVLDLFDGQVRIDNLSVFNILGPVPSIKSNISIESINLEKLTGTFDFGRVSGIISGNIKDLVVVNGQAESFTGSMATVKTKGVNQKISVEALKNISILGTGSSVSILDMGIYRFFRHYGYEKIGFSASLKNDNLQLLGIDRKNGMGYLVKGGLLPPKVDVVNHRNNISFKEMVKRLMRIKQAEQ